ncbi:Mariner Mos1 transposase [Eumeta japonica]|uniref:Mariner Mos1 transposase n=1 Tax=Eumeta variegata TaxID=151549 RepID=A0A4C1W8S2_EUMVA|nr:Mariner Mos1 transposase [Eumeta japonica]
MYEDAELKDLFEEDSSQTQKELILTFEVTQQAVSYRLKTLRTIHKQDNALQPDPCVVSIFDPDPNLDSYSEHSSGYLLVRSFCHPAML